MIQSGKCKVALWQLPALFDHQLLLSNTLLEEWDFNHVIAFQWLVVAEKYHLCKLQSYFQSVKDDALDYIIKPRASLPPLQTIIQILSIWTSSKFFITPGLCFKGTYLTPYKAKSTCSFADSCKGIILQKLARFTQVLALPILSNFSMI